MDYQSIIKDRTAAMLNKRAEEEKINGNPGSIVQYDPELDRSAKIMVNYIDDEPVITIEGHIDEEAAKKIMEKLVEGDDEDYGPLCPWPRYEDEV